MGVSKNRGGPLKWMVYNAKPYYFLNQFIQNIYTTAAFVRKAPAVSYARFQGHEELWEGNLGPCAKQGHAKQGHEEARKSSMEQLQNEVVVSSIFYIFTHNIYLGKISILTDIFQRGSLVQPPTRKKRRNPSVESSLRWPCHNRSLWSTLAALQLGELGSWIRGNPP